MQFASDQCRWSQLGPAKWAWPEQVQVNFAPLLSRELPNFVKKEMIMNIPSEFWFENKKHESAIGRFKLFAVEGADQNI